jgi:hypothetical protein
MMKISFLAAVILILPATNVFAGSIEPTKDNYEKSKSEKAVVLYAVNWGRKWSCAKFDNPNLQNLTFSRLDPVTHQPTGEPIVLDTPEKFSAQDISVPYAILVDPGEYALSGFDIKLAKSVRETRHLKADSSQLFSGGKPTGGTFKVNAGEIVYIGHFGLECSFDPIPWRYYVQGDEYAKYTRELKKSYTFLFDYPVTYRLFQTVKFGM